jgi:hypothetical protein
VEKTALKLIATGLLPKAISFNANNLPDLPTYEPLFDLKFEASESLAIGLSEPETFKKLFTPTIIKIVTATNSSAENARRNASELPRLYCHTRLWKPVKSTDVWRYLGCLLYIGKEDIVCVVRSTQRSEHLKGGLCWPKLSIELPPQSPSVNRRRTGAV